MCKLNTHIRFLDAVFVMLFSTFLTIFAWQTLPILDDGTMWHLTTDGGEIADNQKDVALQGNLREFFAEHGVFWEASAVLHWLSWVGTGLATLHLWSVLFPDQRRFAPVAACLAIAPILCQTQLMLGLPINSQVGPLLTYVAIFMLLGVTQTSFARSAAIYLTATVLVTFSTFLAVYTIPTAVAGTLIVGFVGMRTGKRLRQLVPPIVTLIGSVFAGYLIYWLVAAGSGRTKVRPEVIAALPDFGWRMLIAMGTLFTALWRGALGALLNSLGNIEVSSTELAASMLVGLLVAVIVSILVYRRGHRGDADRGIDLEMWPVLCALSLAIFVAMLPIVLMGARPTGYFGSRFWLPLLPIAACLMSGTVLSLVRSRYWWVVPPICGLVGGYSTCSFIMHETAERQLITDWGTELQKHVTDKGLTVAVFETDWEDWVGSPSNNELTARLTAAWPREQRLRFWAFPTWHHTSSRSGRFGYTLSETSFLTGVGWDRTFDRPYIQRISRGVVRDGPIQRFLWVRVETDKSLLIDSRDINWPEQKKESAEADQSDTFEPLIESAAYGN
jgi:hypothetical protein